MTGAQARVEPVVQLEHVSKEYHRARSSPFRPAPVVHALRDVSLTVHAGERLGIVGESGSGKSTLLRVISGLEHPTTGSVRFDGVEISRLSGRRLRFLRDRVQLVFQDPMGSLDPRMRVDQVVAEPLRARGVRSTRARVEELLVAVGLTAEAADRYPHQFSGGQRQRISIARALTVNPEVLIADEPVSALDVSVRAQVLNLISRLVDDRDLTLVFVSHDLSVIRHLCDRVVVMRAGEIIEDGPTARVWSQPQHPYTRQLIAAIPQLPGSRDLAPREDPR